MYSAITTTIGLVSSVALFVATSIAPAFATNWSYTLDDGRFVTFHSDGSQTVKVASRGMVMEYSADGNCKITKI